MSNFEVYEADVHDFDIQNSLIDIRYLVNVGKVQNLADVLQNISS